MRASLSPCVRRCLAIAVAAALGGHLTAATAQPEPAEPRRAEQEGPDKPKKEKLRLDSRVMGGWEYRERREVAAPASSEKIRYGFELDQARIGLRGRWKKEQLRLRLSADLADVLNPQSPPQVNYLRSAYLEYRAERWLRVRLGRFKRPFSLLRMQGPFEIPFRGRGPGNSYIVERHHWGDRGVGLMLHGKVREPELRYFASMTNAFIGDNGVDLHGRVELEAIEGLTLGANGALKLIDDPARLSDASPPLLGVSAGGGDVTFELGELTVQAQGYAARNPRRRSTGGHPLAASVHGHVGYRFPLEGRWSVTPVVGAEWADADLDFLQSEVVRGLIAANLFWKRSLRITPQLDVQSPSGTVAGFNPWDKRTRILVSVGAEL